MKCDKWIFSFYVEQLCNANWLLASIYFLPNFHRFDCVDSVAWYPSDRNNDENTFFIHSINRKSFVSASLPKTTLLSPTPAISFLTFFLAVYLFRTIPPHTLLKYVFFQETLTHAYFDFERYFLWTLYSDRFQEPLLFKENSARMSGGGRFFNATFQVSACTVAGCGPWSQPVLIMPASGRPDLTARLYLKNKLCFGDCLLNIKYDSLPASIFIVFL